MLEYITTRTLKNSKGLETGRVRVIKFKGNENAKVIYKCPECGFEEEKEEKWKKPFSFRCSKCNLLIRVPSLRAEIKRMRKKRK